MKRISYFPFILSPFPTKEEEEKGCSEPYTKRKLSSD
jgi:hypothetical protein